MRFSEEVAQRCFNSKAPEGDRAHIAQPHVFGQIAAAQIVPDLLGRKLVVVGPNERGNVPRRVGDVALADKKPDGFAESVFGINLQALLHEPPLPLPRFGFD